ncbi:hypothetical protein [Paenibacillus anaericanus]
MFILTLLTYINNNKRK